jgi:allantoicase
VARYGRIDDCDADREHILEYLDQEMTYTHANLTIIPDGEVKRLRVLGVRGDQTFFN